MKYERATERVSARRAHRVVTNNSIIRSRQEFFHAHWQDRMNSLGVAKYEHFKKC